MYRSLALWFVLLAVGAAHPAAATTIDVYPGNIGSGSLSITGTGWNANAAWLTPDGYDFAANRWSYDMTTTGSPVALQGFVDTSQAALANPGDWSKYYAKFAIRDSNNRVVNAVFANDWLGGWNGIDPQPWDRISLETEGNVPGFGNNTPHAQQYYATEGGISDRNLDGSFAGTGSGQEIFPSTREYYFQLIADPTAETFALQVYGMGSSASDHPLDAWPKQNMFDDPRWLELGSITMQANGFNFAEVEFYSILWSSTQAAAGETSTVSWEAMNVGAPLSFEQVPSSPNAIPEPATAGLAMIGLGALLMRRRRA